MYATYFQMVKKLNNMYRARESLSLRTGKSGKEFFVLATFLQV